MAVSIDQLVVDLRFETAGFRAELERIKARFGRPNVVQAGVDVLKGFEDLNAADPEVVARDVGVAMLSELVASATIVKVDENNGACEPAAAD